jgi:hypothetical protein
MLFESTTQFIALSSLRHLGQRTHDLLLCKVNVLERIVKEVLKSFSFCHGVNPSSEFGVLASRTGQMSARTNALLSWSETGKMTTSIISVVAGCHPARASNNSPKPREFISESTYIKARGFFLRKRLPREEPLAVILARL